MSSYNYVDVVLVKHYGCDKLFLFQAPSFSYLEEGDKVICETKFSSEEPGIVEGVRTVTKNDAEFQFICKACGATLPLKKVVAKLKLKEFEYDDEDEEEAVVETETEDDTE